MPILNGEPGPQILADNDTNVLRTGNTGEIIIQDLHGKAFEAGSRGNVYTATISGVQILQPSNTPVLHMLYCPRTNPGDTAKIINVIRVEATMQTLGSGTLSQPAELCIWMAKYTANLIPLAANIMPTFPALIGAPNLNFGKALVSVNTATAGNLPVRMMANMYGAANATVPAASTTSPYYPTYYAEPDGTLMLTGGWAVFICTGLAYVTTQPTYSVTYMWEEI